LFNKEVVIVVDHIWTQDAYLRARQGNVDKFEWVFCNSLISVDQKLIVRASTDTMRTHRMANDVDTYLAIIRGQKYLESFKKHPDWCSLISMSDMIRLRGDQDYVKEIVAKILV